MTKTQKIVTSLFSLILCFFFVVSIVDTKELKQETGLSQENIMTHVEKLSENGPRSIANKEANEKAVEYIVSQLESWGFVNEDTTDQPSYLVQEYVAIDSRYQNWTLKNVIAHVPSTSPNRTGDAVMFMGHFDSVPMGQGASDDGVACSTMLEAIRYYSENKLDATNDLVFSFVNGEEYGLYGSKALMAEFDGFDHVVERTKFVTNLESRGTDGTLIMFETAKNNYNTVKLFSEINKSIFTCSIATLVYDTMPNYTDFTTFKDAYQGINMANIMGGENYHTQNDNPENVGASYLSQQAQIVENLISKLNDYDLDLLYDAEESAIFFSYLNMTTVVYNHTTVIVLAVLAILMVIANILLSILYRKGNNILKTAKGILAIIAGLALTAGVAYVCYYIFQWIAVLFGVIDIHMVGTITYSNVAIVIGIGILALSMTVLTTHFACKWLKIERRDMTRAFAYIHAILGIVLSFALPDASYLFIFSGIMLMINELLITCFKNTKFENCHGELLATALYLPIVIPVIFLATSALGLTMAYVYGLVFALSIFAVGIAFTPACKYITVRVLKKKGSPAEGALHLLAVSLVIFLCVSLVKPNANVNLQGKQNIVKLPYDDALVYVLDANGESEYRIYDLNSVSALEKYAPEMTYTEEYYVGKGENVEISNKILSTFENNILTIEKTDEKSLVYLDFTNVNAKFFTVTDETGEQTYHFTGNGTTYSIKLHDNCTVTVYGGAANVAYKEVLRDYAALVPTEYANDDEMLHFNLWLTDSYSFNA